MAVSEDLINFDLLEGHKENIQSLPGGRSARQLLGSINAMPTGRGLSSPTLDETKTLNDAIRQEYENELRDINESDDPLDIYDRYVKWTLNAYPSAQATPTSQLLPLLERATKSFLTSSHYKNDPRYLKLWLHYIRFFSDTPRETFAFLARHNIGEGLGLFYEEFAAWLEGAGRWAQAEEVYKLGIEREARPAERLLRKYEQFQKRLEARPASDREPTSPALPTVRPALAAKIDPFAAAPREEQQAPRPTSGTNGTSRSGKPKMAIFSDARNPTPPPSGSTTSGWDNIGSIKDRKKENTIEAKPWTGETLKAGKRVGTGEKMAIFKDPNSRAHETKFHQPSISKFPADVVNPRTGRAERVFVNVEAVYPNEQEEFSFEELRAMSRGWSGRTWGHKKTNSLQKASGNVSKSPKNEYKSSENVDVENLSEELQAKANISENSTQEISQPTVDAKPKKERRLKVREIKQETQTVKTRLESPTGRGKIRRKNSAEPTMTFHSRAAQIEIYDIFNKPHEKNLDDTQSGDDTDLGEDGYSTAGESTGTGRISENTGEFDDTFASVPSGQENLSSQPVSVSPWSDFTSSKHMPRPKHKGRQTSEDLTENMNSSQNQTQTGGFDTQAIAAIANADFGDFDTKVIAAMAGDYHDGEDEIEQRHTEEVKTPDEPELHLVEVQNKPRYVPLPPEDYEPTPLRPFRDPDQAHQNRLPFMTPIVEKTESSLGANTAFSQRDYQLTKTPSKHVNGHYESPAKLKLEQFLISSPQQHSPSPKRKLEDHTSASEAELLTSSPEKKKLFSPEKVEKIQEPTPPPEQQVLAPPVFKTPALPVKTFQPPIESSGPVIQDLQCNPVDYSIRKQILASVNLSAYPGYHDYSSEKSQHYSTLKRYADKVATKVKSSPRKNADKTTQAIPPILNFTGTTRVYAVKKLLGKGAFAPVYLADSYDNSAENSPSGTGGTIQARSSLEAIKTDHPPLNSTWEFHILRLLSTRLSSTHLHLLPSIIAAEELHVFADEAFLILHYHSQGTLLDLANWTREERIKTGKPAGEGLDEVLAMFFTVQLLRVLEAIHTVGIMHGDLKGDNVLLRLEDCPLTSPYTAADTDVAVTHNGWTKKGITLIDFGRGIDVHAFQENCSFIADWDADSHDCAEVREKRPWKWQLDYFGVAGVVHTLLFGKDIATVPVSVVSSSSTSVEHNGGIGIGGNSSREWKLREGFKRYWQQGLWEELFYLLCNSAVVARGSVDGGVGVGGGVGISGGIGKGKGRIDTQLGDIRARMEGWLEGEGERRDLRGCVRRVERLVAERMKGRK